MPHPAARAGRVPGARWTTGKGTGIPIPVRSWPGSGWRPRASESPGLWPSDGQRVGPPQAQYVDWHLHTDRDDESAVRGRTHATCVLDAGQPAIRSARDCAAGCHRYILLTGCGAYACRMSQFARERSATLGPDARPVAIPDDVDAPGVAKATGVVELPLRVRWTGPTRRYNLADRNDRARVYEQVLAEGTEEDVRFYVVIDDLIDLWPELVLPQRVRQAWARWLAARRGVTVAC